MSQFSNSNSKSNHSFKKVFQRIYLFKRLSKRERERESSIEIIVTAWFGQSQELHAGVPTWVAETQEFEPASAAFPRARTGSWRSWDLNLHFSIGCYVGSLTLDATTPASELSFIEHSVCTRH